MGPLPLHRHHIGNAMDHGLAIAPTSWYRRFMELTTVQQGTRSVEVLTHGEGGRLAVLLHGFPDDMVSMAPLMRQLAELGFRCVAPRMRGYQGQLGPNANYHVARLGQDIVELTTALRAQGAVLVGHDWGAIAAYAACALSPQTFSCAVTLSMPPPAVLVRALTRHPTLLARAWHLAFFQVPALPEAVFMAHEGAFIEQLWRAWSPGWDPPPEALSSARAGLTQARALGGALGTYRALFARGYRHPWSAWRSWRLVKAPLRVPTLMLTGEKSGWVRPAMFHGVKRAFDAPHRVDVIEHAGYFLHLEVPHRVARAIADFSPACTLHEPDLRI